MDISVPKHHSVEEAFGGNFLIYLKFTSKYSEVNKLQGLSKISVGMHILTNTLVR